MQNLLSKLLHLMGSLIVALTVVTPNPTPAPSPVVEPVQGIESPTPSSTPTPNLLDRMHAPTVPELVEEYNQLKEEVLAYTPEPTPTPQIVIIQVTPLPTINPTPMATPKPRTDLSIGRFQQKSVRAKDFGYNFIPENPSRLESLVFLVNGEVLKPTAIHPNKEWYMFYSGDDMASGSYKLELTATYKDGSSGTLTGKIKLPPKEEVSQYGSDLKGMDAF